MSQKAFSTKDDDTFTEQQTRRWRRNEAGRSRRYGRQTQERPVTFQLNNKMLKSRGLKSSRTLQSEGAGSSHSGSQRNCAAHGNKTEENGGQSSAVREIPGFYYDPGKKRYFKITKDHPGKKFAPCQCDGWKNVSEDNPPRIIPSNIEVIKKPTKISIVKHLQQREYVRHSQIPGRNMLEKLSRLLKIKQRLRLDPVSDNYVFVEVDKFSVSRIEPDANHEKILTLYETQPSGKQMVQFHSLSNDKNNNLEIEHHFSMTRNQKITSLLWSPHKSTKNLYIESLSGYGSTPGETMIFQVDGTSQRIIGRYTVQGSTVWTNSWSRNPLFSNIISIGASKVALTWDINTKRRLIYAPSDSDVFAQEFSRRYPILFIGSRDGLIRTCDIRLTGSHWPVMCLRQGKLASVTCIRVLHDENYLLSSGLDGSLKRWDLRVRACVQNYSGHINEITHGLPFYVDPSDSLIFAAGQDSVTRIWSVASGELLHSIPFPDSVDKSLCSIPALYYSEAWGGNRGMPGLLYGAGDSIYSYTF